MDHPHPHRRIQAYLSSLGTTQIHLRNPWVIAFFSFSFPGFGYLMLERYLTAFVFIGWEVFINTKANINLGILYTFLGDFGKTKQVMKPEWLILYVSIYFFNIWDSCRATVDTNKQYLLAEREDARLPHFKLSAWDINFMDKKKPGIALFWSVLAPGVGHIYVHKIIVGFFIFAATVMLMYYSKIPEALQYTFTGDFRRVVGILDMQWALYLPSIFAFIFYDAYISVVEHNKLFEKEQAHFLRDRYQSPSFPMPIRDR